MASPESSSLNLANQRLSQELSDRKTQLSAELQSGREKECTLGRNAYIWSQSLFTAALLCSVAAAVCGLFFDVSGKIVGGIAALPPLIAFVAVNLKLEERANWHYRKSNMFESLNSRLRYQLPEIPSADNIAAIARDRDKAVADMESEWEHIKATNFSEMLKQKRQLISQMAAANRHTPDS